MPLFRTIRESLWPRVPTLRIPSVNRLTLDRELRRHFLRLEPGVVLDIGAKSAPYAADIPSTQYVRLDVDASRKPDICCDIHDLKGPANHFDTVLALEVLEHLHDPALAIERMRLVLKLGGTCILSTRFLYRYHADPEDHYRFTWDSLHHLFRHFRHVEVHHHGNRLQVIWELLNAGGRMRALLNVFNPLVALPRSKRTKFPLGFVVFAKK